MAEDSTSRRLARFLEDTNLSRSEVEEFVNAVQNGHSGDLQNMLARLYSGITNFEQLGRASLQLYQDLRSDKDQLVAEARQGLEEENNRLREEMDLLRKENDRLRGASGSVKASSNPPFFSFPKVHHTDNARPRLLSYRHRPRQTFPSRLLSLSEMLPRRSHQTSSGTQRNSKTSSRPVEIARHFASLTFYSLSLLAAPFMRSTEATIFSIVRPVCLGIQLIRIQYV